MDRCQLLLAALLSITYCVYAQQRQHTGRKSNCRKTVIGRGKFVFFSLKINQTITCGCTIDLCITTPVRILQPMKSPLKEWFCHSRSHVARKYFEMYANKKLLPMYFMFLMIINSLLSSCCHGCWKGRPKITR